MPTVIIVRPDNTPEEEKKALKFVANVIEKIIFEEYGIETTVTLIEKLN